MKWRSHWAAREMGKTKFGGPNKFSPRVKRSQSWHDNNNNALRPVIPNLFFKYISLSCSPILHHRGRGNVIGSESLAIEQLKRERGNLLTQNGRGDKMDIGDSESLTSDMQLSFSPYGKYLPPPFLAKISIVSNHFLLLSKHYFT